MAKTDFVYTAFLLSYQVLKMACLGTESLSHLLVINYLCALYSIF